MQGRFNIDLKSLEMWNVGLTEDQVKKRLLGLPIRATIFDEDEEIKLDRTAIEYLVIGGDFHDKLPGLAIYPVKIPELKNPKIGYDNPNENPFVRFSDSDETWVSFIFRDILYTLYHTFRQE